MNEQILSPQGTTLWVEVNLKTRRLTSNYKILARTHPGPGLNWILLHDLSLRVMLLNGTKSFNTFALVGGKIVEVPEHIDLRFLTHLSSEIWPHITAIDHKWTNIPWVPLDVPKIEPDNWELFWELWNAKQSDITRGLNETQFWKGLCCYLHPSIDHTQFNYSNTVIDDWSKHFPKMFEQIKSCLPYTFLEKIVLWSNVNEVTPHFDPDAQVCPWPDSLRIMLWDTNDRPTFYMSRWPNRTEEFNPPLIQNKRLGAYGVSASRVPIDKRMYVNLPAETNTFAFNNGAFLHGADLAKPKIIMAVKGRMNIDTWLSALSTSHEKYKGYIHNANQY